MPNLNLLEGKGLYKEVDFEDTESISFQDFERRQEPEERPQEEETTPVGAAEEETVKTSDYQFGERRSSWPIVAAIVGVLIIGFVLIWAYRSRKGGEVVTAPPPADTTAAAVAQAPPQPTTTPAKTEAPAPETTPAREAQQPAAAPTPAPVSEPEITAVVSEGLDRKRQKGAVAATLLDDFFGAIPSNMILTFFRYDGKSYVAEIGAESPQLFGQFVQKLRSVNSDLAPKTTFEREELLGDRVITIRQIQGTVPVSVSPPRGSTVLQSGVIKTKLTGLAARHQLTVKQLSVSPPADIGGNRIRAVTVKLSGNQGDVIAYIQDLLRTYQNIGVNKVLITVITPLNLSSTNVNAVLDLDVFLE